MKGREATCHHTTHLMMMMHAGHQMCSRVGGDGGVLAVVVVVVVVAPALCLWCGDGWASECGWGCAREEVATR